MSNQAIDHKADSQKDIRPNNADSSVIDSIDELTFDECYVDFYLASKNKTQSYIKACKAIGCDYNEKYVSQYALSIHKRLNRDGAIQSALQGLLLDDQVGSRLTLNELRTDSDSDNIKLQAAKHQSGDLYSEQSTQAGIVVNVNRDNVVITHKNQSLKIESDNTNDSENEND